MAACTLPLFAEIDCLARADGKAGHAIVSAAALGPAGRDGVQLDAGYFRAGAAAQGDIRHDGTAGGQGGKIDQQAVEYSALAVEQHQIQAKPVQGLPQSITNRYSCQAALGAVFGFLQFQAKAGGGSGGRHQACESREQGG